MVSNLTPAAGAQPRSRSGRRMPGLKVLPGAPFSLTQQSRNPAPRAINTQSQLLEQLKHRVLAAESNLTGPTTCSPVLLASGDPRRKRGHLHPACCSPVLWGDRE